MRKLLLTGALVLITAMAFAQNAPAPAMVFTGALYTGAVVQSFPNPSYPIMGIWDPVNQTGSRFNFQGTYNGTGFGLNFRLREDDNWNQGYTNQKAGTPAISVPAAPSFRRLYAWIDAANGLVRVAAGRLSGYEWATGDAGGFSTFGNLDGAVGMQLQLKPMDGLNVGLFVPFTYGTSTNLISFEDVNDSLDTVAFGAKYTLKGLGDIEGGYWLAPTTATSTGSSAFYQYPFGWLGAEFVGMQNLTAILETRFANSSNANVNYAYLDEQVSYALDQLGLTLYAEQLIWASGATGPNSGADVAFRPVVDYTIGMADVGVFAQFTYTGAAGKMGYSGGPFVKLTFAKNVYMKLQGEVGGGDVYPPTNGSPFQSWPGNIGATYLNAGNWNSTLSGTFYQANLNFVVSF